jgi:hypothetical protein
MKIGRMRGTHAVCHSHKFFLSGGETVKPFGGKTIVRIGLKQAHAFSVVSKEGMAIGTAVVGSAAVPCLTIEDNDAAFGGRGLHNVFDVHVFWWNGQAAFV